MSFLKIVRMILLVLIMLVAIFFTVKNPNERVRIDLLLLPPRENVLLVEVLFYTLLIGVIGGLSVAALKILELQGTVRSLRRTRARLEGELTTLRNLPLEDAEGAGSPSEEES